MTFPIVVLATPDNEMLEVRYKMLASQKRIDLLREEERALVIASAFASVYVATLCFLLPTR
ncbi:uncharacterized protein Z520_02507 [Fonsecaea multimorphosa CBS 102226]|uniref:Uncharacterized protein n=1 Tax=Fonsecaea multimorphosa CBS 102226 TaxID=1442371 RepID=A0A0D2L058_9EURO|nr:uncharacterized protein Z520_02507 [Fonsecaea multimorphosa CBS 102226]KIY02369.1 hypothetical protein Z520_02507 [Fonsecaea multimorphosa CBS 102226]